MPNRFSHSLILSWFALLLCYGLGFSGLVNAKTLEELRKEEAVNTDIPVLQEHEVPQAKVKQNQLRQEVRQRFLKHIEHARNISIPYDPKEFFWKIDWKSQQNYCKSVADALFKHKERLTFREPDVSLSKQTIEEANEKIKGAFPGCEKWANKIENNDRGVDFYLYEDGMSRLGRKFGNWEHDYYILADQYLAREWMVPKVSAPGRGDTFVTLKSTEVKNEYKCPGSELEFYPHERIVLGSTKVLGFVDNKPVVFMFGQYPDTMPKGKYPRIEDGKLVWEELSPGGVMPYPLRLGKPGQRFVFVATTGNNLYEKWALSPPVIERYFSADVTPDELPHEVEGVYGSTGYEEQHLLSCVINFGAN